MTGRADRRRAAWPGAADLPRLLAAISEPCARMFAQINEATTRLHAAVRRLGVRVPAGRVPFESLERRGLLSAGGVPECRDAGRPPPVRRSTPPTSRRWRPRRRSRRPPRRTARPTSSATRSSRPTSPSPTAASTSRRSPPTPSGSTAPPTARPSPRRSTPPPAATCSCWARRPLLEPDTEYTFEVTAGLRDVTGVSFVPFATQFRTGVTTAAGDSTLKFDKVALDVPAAAYTAVTKGPDGRLYAGVETGEIYRFDIKPRRHARATRTLIRSLVDANGGEPRLLTGIEFDPQSNADDLALWVTHSHAAHRQRPRVDGQDHAPQRAGPGDRAGLRRRPAALDARPRDQPAEVRPRRRALLPAARQHRHGRAGLRLALPPRAAADRRRSCGSTPASPATASRRGRGRSTCRPRTAARTTRTGADAPVTIYATGVRNAYDLLWHSNGSLYAPTNGSQRGGATPAGPGVPGIGFVDQVEDDFLHRIHAGGYYGHPNPDARPVRPQRRQPDRRRRPVRGPAVPRRHAARPELPPARSTTSASTTRPTASSSTAAARSAGRSTARSWSPATAAATTSSSSPPTPDGHIVDAKAGIEGLQELQRPARPHRRRRDRLPLRRRVRRADDHARQADRRRRSPPANPRRRPRAPLGPYGLAVAAGGAGRAGTELGRHRRRERLQDRADRRGRRRLDAGRHDRRQRDALRRRQASSAARRTSTASAPRAPPAARSIAGRRRRARRRSSSRPAGRGADIGALGQARHRRRHRRRRFELAGGGAGIGGLADAFFLASVPVTRRRRDRRPRRAASIRRTPRPRPA